jgi:hypothetical protein
MAATTKNKVTSWKLWRKALTRTICTENLTLNGPLGYWLILSDHCHIQYNHDNIILYQMSNNKWYQYNQVTIAWRKLGILDNKEKAQSPEAATPITDVQTANLEYKCIRPSKLLKTQNIMEDH